MILFARPPALASGLVAHAPEEPAMDEPEVARPRDAWGTSPRRGPVIRGTDDGRTRSVDVRAPQPSRDTPVSMPTDPLLFLIAIAERVAHAETGRLMDDASDLRQRAAASRDQAERARRAASRAERRARRWLRGAPRFLRRLVRVVLTAASIAAAGCTGGASLGLALASATLTLGADGFARVASRCGGSAGLARAIRTACQVAGLALGAAGGVSASLRVSPSAGEGVARTVTRGAVDAYVGTLADSVSAALRLGDQARRTAASALGHRAATLAGRADAADLASERGRTTAQHVIEDLRASLGALAEQRGRLLATLAERRATELATAAGEGR